VRCVRNCNGRYLVLVPTRYVQVLVQVLSVCLYSLPPWACALCLHANVGSTLLRNNNKIYRYESGDIDCNELFSSLTVFNVILALSSRSGHNRHPP
jgi:hypothetical protein